ncbi:MAG: dihydrodipicolinate reductase [Actinomycetes bacterium]
MSTVAPMSNRVVVWGTGNVGRPAIRAVAANRDLELVGVVVSNPDKVGRDAGELAGIETLGVSATADSTRAWASDVDAVVYAATADTRPDDAYGDLVSCLTAGVNVVSTSFYPLLHPKSAPRELLDVIEPACAVGNSSVFVSGIDPGWALDILPAFISGVSAGITEIRVQEVFNYALYDQPDVVRDVIGFGQTMDEIPLMLLDFSLDMVWSPMVRVLAELLTVELDDIEIAVERRPLERSIDVPGMGTFDAGTQGAFRFEVRGVVAGKPLIVVEHVTRIDDDCAPDWPTSTSPGGEHRVVITGHPNLTVSVHGTEVGESGAAGGGNATAANRIVNAIPAVCAAPAGALSAIDLPPITGAAQLR